MERDEEEGGKTDHFKVLEFLLIIIFVIPEMWRATSRSPLLPVPGSAGNSVGADIRLAPPET